MLSSERSLPPKPNRTLLLKVAYYDAVDMAFANRNFINTDYPWTWFSGTAEFLPHVLLFEFLYSLPVKVQFPGNVFNRLGVASLADIEGEALCVERVIRKERQFLLFHLCCNSDRKRVESQVQCTHAYFRRTDRELAYPCGRRKCDELCCMCCRLFFP